MTATRKIIVGVTGASGACYATRLLRALLAGGHHVHLTMSKYGRYLLHEERGFDKSVSTVTLFAGDGVQGVMDQQSRTPESLIATFAECLKSVAHPKLAMAADAMLVVSPEHAQRCYDAGSDKEKFRTALEAKTMRAGVDLIRGANDIAEGLPEHLKDATIPKFQPGGLH